jgi:tetratricopeptide (TPR) repeat protein
MAALRGVSANFLKLFVQKLQDASWSTQQVCTHVIKPETEELRCAYLDLWEGKTDVQGAPYVAPATVFVSHAWKYSFIAVCVDVMISYAEKNPDVYFWFDLFVNNQHGTAAIPFDWWTNRFRQSIQDIGSVLLIMSPWNDPVPITRAWCLFEIMCTLQCRQHAGVRFDIMLPAAERAALQHGIALSFQSILNALIGIRAQKATCFKEEDRVSIMAAVEATVGFDALNAEVKDVLRDWYVATGREFADAALASGNALGADFAGYLLNLGASLRALGRFQETIQYCSKAAEIFTETLGPDHVLIATAYNNIGEACRSQRRYEEALDFNTRALAIQQAGPVPCAADVAGTLNNLGIVQQSQGNHDAALELHARALAMRQQALGPAHAEVADTYNNIAHSLRVLDRFGMSLLYYGKALDIRITALGPNHPDVAAACSNIAAVCAAHSENSSALDFFTRALAIRLDTVGAGHPDIAANYKNIAAVHASLGQDDLSREFYAKALVVCASDGAQAQAIRRDMAHLDGNDKSLETTSIHAESLLETVPMRAKDEALAEDDDSLAGYRCSISENEEDDGEMDATNSNFAGALAGRCGSICLPSLSIHRKGKDTLPSLQSIFTPPPPPPATVATARTSAGGTQGDTFNWRLNFGLDRVLDIAEEKTKLLEALSIARTLLASISSQSQMVPAAGKDGVPTEEVGTGVHGRRSTAIGESWVEVSHAQKTMPQRRRRRRDNCLAS